MNDYLLVALVTVGVTILLITAIRWRYGSGLMSRFFTLMMPTIAVTAFVGVVLGKEGIRLDYLGGAVVVAGSFVIGMTVVIQRSIVARLQQEADSPHDR